MPAAERARFCRDPAWRDRARADVARQWHYTFDKVFVQETAAQPELADGPSLGELAAQRAVVGIPGWGRVAPGYFTDLVAFAPAAVGVERMERVLDLPAGADRLVARSHRLHQVWVNGQPVTEGGPRAGRLIRDGGTSAGPAPR